MPVNLAYEKLFSLPEVRRGWPSAKGSITFEFFEDGGRLRAGQISEDGEVKVAAYARDSKIPDLGSVAGELVVHRYKRRAVVLSGDRVMKCVRAGKAEPIARFSQAIGVALNSGSAQGLLTSPAVLEQTDSSVVFARVEGKTLHDLDAAGLAGWDVFAQSWKAFQEFSLPFELPVHDAEAEIAVLQRWVAMLETFEVPVPDEPERLLAEVLSPLLASTCDQLREAPDTWINLHRDLHDKQLIWDGAVLNVLDLDTAARGEAALDLANLWVHLELREVQGVFVSSTVAHVKNLLRTLLSESGVSAQRFEAYAAAARLRILCVYAFRPSEKHWQRQWFERLLSQPR